MTQSGHKQANFAVMHNRATLRILCRNQSESTVNSQSLRQTPLQWEIVALIKALNVVAIEALVTDLHPGPQCAHGRKLLDGEQDRLRCGRKAAIAQRLSWAALALCHEQLGGYVVVECHSLAVGRHIDVPTRLMSVRVSARSDGGRQARLPVFSNRPCNAAAFCRLAHRSAAGRADDHVKSRRQTRPCTPGAWHASGGHGTTAEAGACNLRTRLRL